MEVPPQTICEVVDVVAATVKMGVNVEWNRILGEITAENTLICSKRPEV